MTRPFAYLTVAVLAALVVVGLATARPTRPGPAARPPAVHNQPGATTEHGEARHPYWALERKFVAQGHALGRANAEVRRLRSQVAVRSLQERLSAVATIRLVFGPTYGDQAVTVSSCETGGTFDPGARNGQYHGVLQMGARERAIYGDSDTVLGQALAAYRYFAATGYDWSPWECRP